MPSSHHFTIDTTEFGIGSVTLSTDPLDSTFTLEITGDAARATAIGKDDAPPFGWIIYPPKFYVRGAVFARDGDAKTLNIDEDALDEYDIALYLIDHNDVLGRLTLSVDGTLTFTGSTSINGTDRPLSLSCPATFSP